MRIFELLESKESISALEDLSYFLLLSIRKSKKDKTFEQRKQELTADYITADSLFVISLLMDEETTHIRKWLASSKKLLS